MRDFKINLTESYPIIVTPKYLNSVSNEVLKFEDFYPNLKKPIFIPVTPKEKEGLGVLGCGCFIILLWFAIGLPAVIISNILNVSSLDYQTYWFPWVLGIFLFSLVVLIYSYYKVTDFTNKKEEIDINTENAKRREIFNKELKEYETLVKKIKSKEFEKTEILKRLSLQSKSNFDWIFKSLVILDDKDVKKGMSEEFFYKFLKKYSEYTVYKSIKCSFYFPDLIIVKDNLVIDLEIDEPYAFDTKEPIHFKNSDNDRNDFFIKNGYILLRFTENQILDNPEVCLNIIHDVIKSCLTLDKFDLKNYNDIKAKFLTFEQCFDLAYNNSRVKIPSKIEALELKYGL